MKANTLKLGRYHIKVFDEENLTGCFRCIRYQRQNMHQNAWQK